MPKERRELFPRRLAAARRGAGLTQADLAEKIGYSLSAVRSWEQDGVREPNFSTVVELAKMFHISTDYLIGEDDEPNAKMRDVASYIGVSQPAAAKLEALSKKNDHRTLPLNGLIMDIRFEHLISSMWLLHERAKLIAEHPDEEYSREVTTKAEHHMECVISGMQLVEYELDNLVAQFRHVLSRICMVDDAREAWDTVMVERTVARMEELSKNSGSTSDK